MYINYAGKYNMQNHMKIEECQNNDNIGENVSGCKNALNSTFILNQQSNDHPLITRAYMKLISLQYPS